MIVNFSVQNFGPIKDKQTLSFEADKSSLLEDYYIIQALDDVRVLKLGLIYGANASGKTTILNALDFLRDLVIEPETKKTETLDFNPFLFDVESSLQNSHISIDLIQNGTRYFYEVEFNRKAIINEELYFYNPKKNNVYKRSTDVEKQLSLITFNSKIEKDKDITKTLAANTLWNNTVLGGFIKTNIEQKHLKDVTDWFANYLKRIIVTQTDLSTYVTARIDNAEIQKETVLNILKQADFNISNILIEKKEEAIPNGFIEFLEKQVKAPSDKLEELKIKGKVTSLNLEFEHTVNKEKYSLPFDLESQGTKRYYGFAGVLSLVIQKPAIFPIDELESSLHPDLFTHFIVSFLINSKKSQIIATTHNREVFNNKDIFRNDAIWFTDKSEKGTTELYSLADFDTSVIRDTTNVYNAYKAGKLGGIPNLGDYFIDIEDEAK
ncbi:hypothetical protein LX64_04903 [Chitinophaga skermanii]|uniref:ATPase AAA-type core domain-containing protein n=1 Tax=Chitinophaga skermanii TaxID=331697 RepID=A0A327Q1W4_9BACT|nr:ATP-binding protein [Chitinophaga skermanii]RAI97854.1 hypothetical protein LX64_04903 [Chitinophaga skermanii]